MNVLVFASIFGLVSLSLVAGQSACTGAEVKGNIISSVDSTISQHTNVIADLEVKCKGGVPANFALYAEYNGKLYSAAHSLENPAKFQISISDESVNVRSSDVTLRVFDEEGYQLTKKGGAAKPLATLSHTIRYPYSGFGVNSEVLVVVLGAAAVYLAHGVRSRL
jgi:Translocon-associated protein, delta subunit precursor (TRAP-delta)